MHDAMIAFVWDSKSGPDADPYAYEEESHTETDKRKVMKLSPILVGLATGLNIFVCCLSISEYEGEQRQREGKGGGVGGEKSTC